MIPSVNSQTALLACTVLRSWWVCTHLPFTVPAAGEVCTLPEQEHITDSALLLAVPYSVVVSRKADGFGHSV